MGEEGRNAADGADLAFDVVERDIAFGRRIEFQDARNGESLPEFLPDVGAQPVAAADAQAMRALARVFRRVDQIAGELADILQQRAVAVDDIVPEPLRGKFLTDQHRAAAHQHGAGGDHTADAVIQRQAIVHAVVGAGIHQAGEPKTPLQNPAMADIDGLRQSGRAGGVDQERAIRDASRRGVPPASADAPDKSLDRAVDAVEFTAAAAAMRPDFRGCRA